MTVSDARPKTTAEEVADLDVRFIAQDFQKLN
jgi:hypothetical protein